MRLILYFIAVFLIGGWALCTFVWEAGSLIHIQLGLGVVIFAFALFLPKRIVNVNE